MAYSHLNHNVSPCQPWTGWKKLWNFRVASRAKHFICLLFWGKRKMYNFVYSLNLGSQTPCIFLFLEYEIVEHLIYSYFKSQIVWSLVNDLVSKNISFPNGFLCGMWIDSNQSGNSVFVNFVIAATSLFIWKGRCNYIFKNEPLDLNYISRRDFPHAKEYSSAPTS